MNSHLPKSKKPLLILGIGNYLMGDEGLGSHFAQQFKNDFPAGIDILDGGTGGFHLMSYFEQYEKVILIDATLEENAPGKIQLIQPKFASDFPRSMSTHDIGLKDVIESLILLDTLPEIYLFTVTIHKVQPMEVNLSPLIEKALLTLKDQIEILVEKLYIKQKFEE